MASGNSTKFNVRLPHYFESCIISESFCKVVNRTVTSQGNSEIRIMLVTGVTVKGGSCTSHQFLLCNVKSLGNVHRGP